MAIAYVPTYIFDSLMLGVKKPLQWPLPCPQSLYTVVVVRSTITWMWFPSFSPCPNPVTIFLLNSWDPLFWTNQSSCTTVTLLGLPHLKHHTNWKHSSHATANPRGKVRTLQLHPICSSPVGATLPCTLQRPTLFCH